MAGGTNGTATITGVAATGQSGAISANGGASVYLSGVQGNGSAGTITATGAALATITGVSAAGQAGTISAYASTPDATATIIGVEGAGQAGTITAVGEVVEVGITAGGGGGYIPPRKRKLKETQDQFINRIFRQDLEEIPSIISLKPVQEKLATNKVEVDPRELNDIRDRLKKLQVEVANLAEIKRIEDEDDLILLLLLEC